jgi:electron transfer flavoprotein alpha subunit
MTEKQKCRGVLALVDREDAKAAYAAFELLAMGKKLADKLGECLTAAVIGHEVRAISEEIAYFADKVYLIDNPLLAEFRAEIYADVLKRLCQAANPNILLLSHNLDNLDLAPRLSYEIGTQLITDCIDFDIDPETGALLYSKPVYSGNAVAVFKIEKKPKMATLRPHVIEPMERGSHKGEIVNFDVSIGESLVEVESIERVIEETVKLDKADAIVSSGRGIKEFEQLKEIQELASVLKRTFPKVGVGTSRPRKDAGWFSSIRQVGLSGEKVAPQLYIAIGISGAPLHLCGMLESKKIVAINVDPEANIFRVADYGVVGKWEEVVPAFRKKLEKLL